MTNKDGSSSPVRKEALQDLHSVQNELPTRLKYGPNSTITEEKTGLTIEQGHRLEGIPGDFLAQQNLGCDDNNSFDMKDLNVCDSTKKDFKNSGSSMSFNNGFSFDESATRGYNEDDDSFDMEGLTVSDSTFATNSESSISIEGDFSLDDYGKRKCNEDDNDSFDMEDLTVSNSTTVTNSGSIITIGNDVIFEESAHRADNDNRSIDITFLEKGIDKQRTSQTHTDIPSSSNFSSTIDRDGNQNIKGILLKPTYVGDDDVRGCRDLKPRRRTVKRERTRRIRAVQFTGIANEDIRMKCLV